MADSYVIRQGTERNTNPMFMEIMAKDLTELATYASKCTPGSLGYLEDGTVYRLGTQGAFVKTGENVPAKIAGLTSQLADKVNIDGVEQVTPENTSFFDSADYFKAGGATPVPDKYADISGIVINSTNVCSIILPVKPSTFYTLVIPGANRGIIVGNTTSEFTHLSTYEVIRSSNSSVADGITFTTKETTRFIFAYFYASAYDYAGNVANIHLYQGAIPTETPKVKKSYLPSDVQYSGQLIKTKTGLDVLVFGDSITQTHHFTVDGSTKTSAYAADLANSYVNATGEIIYYWCWPTLIQRKINIRELRNYALSGATYKDASRTSGNERQNVSYGPLSHAALMSAVAAGDADEPEDAPDNEPGTIIATGDVYIRSLPSTSGAKCAVLHKGERLERAGEDTESWFGVLHNGKQRYASKKYAKVMEV